MTTWYKVSVKYTKQLQDGTLKRVTEPYLVNSISHTDAEAIIHQEVGEFVRGEFLVSGITPLNIADLFLYEDSEKWIQAKVSYVTEDADSGRAKKIANTLFVSADNLADAYKRLTESLKGLQVDFSIDELKMTNYENIFIYSAPEEIS